MYITLVSHICCSASEGASAKDRHPNGLIQALGEGETAASIWLILYVVLASRFDEWLQVTHILKNLTIAIVDAVLAVEAMFENFALGVELIYDWVSVTALMVREYRDLAQLRHFQKKFPQVGPLVDIDATSTILFIKDSEIVWQ